MKHPVRDLPLAPPTGMADILPPDAAARQHFAGRLTDVFASFGYELVTTPLFEHAAVIERGLDSGDRRALLRFVEPDSGELACGWQGEGRMSDPEVIADAAESVLTPSSLAGEHVVVTAGGTGEPVDSVRRLTNHSSGKMGFAVAAEAARRGARVTLVAGLTPLATPFGVDRVDVETAVEMRDAVMAAFPDASIVIWKDKAYTTRALYAPVSVKRKRTFRGIHKKRPGRKITFGGCT